MSLQKLQEKHSAQAKYYATLPFNNSSSFEEGVLNGRQEGYILCLFELGMPEKDIALRTGAPLTFVRSVLK